MPQRFPPLAPPEQVPARAITLAYLPWGELLILTAAALICALT